MTSDPVQQRWWNSRFVLPKTVQPLHKDSGEIVVHSAVQAYADAIESIENSSTDENSTTVGDVLDAAWTTYVSIQGDNNSNVRLAKAAWEWREKLQRAIDGCHSTDAMLAAAQASYSEFEGSEVHAPVPSGYQSIAESMAAQGIDILFGHQVDRVVTDAPVGSTITCTNGVEIQCECVIVTVSLGVLKTVHRDMFVPGLLKRKVHAIEDGLEIGTVDKILVTCGSSDSCEQHGGEEKVEYEPHDDDVATFALLWDGTDGNSSNSTTRYDLPRWAPGIFSIRFGGPEFKRIKRSSDATAHNKRKKNEHLVAWICGEDAVEMEEASDEDVLRVMKHIITTEFPAIGQETDLFTPLCRERSDSPSSPPPRIVRSRWHKDPLFRGSYSYVGKHGTLDDVAALAEPIVHPITNRPVVMFAGEACLARYIGTTTAAYLTGKAAAETVLLQYKNNTNNMHE